MQTELANKGIEPLVDESIYPYSTARMQAAILEKLTDDTDQE